MEIKRTNKKHIVHVTITQSSTYTIVKKKNPFEINNLIHHKTLKNI